MATAKRTMMATAKSTVFHVHSERDIGLVTESLKMMSPTEEKSLLVQIGPDTESRSLKQNRLSFFWYNFIGKASGHGKEYERASCKLQIGVPILREHEEYNEKFAVVLDPLCYEDQLEAMDLIDVTSLMTVAQFAEYLNEIDQKSASRGIVLPQPADLYWDALMKEEGER